MIDKKKQEQIVYEIVKANSGGIRTEQVKIAAMYKGVSCADRYLRWLAEKGLIYGERMASDKTKTWKPVKNPVRIEYDEDLLWRKQQQEAAKDELFILKAMDIEGGTATMYSWEILEKIASMIDKEGCLFPDVAGDFLECEFYCRGGCLLFEKLDCPLIDEKDKGLIKMIVAENKKEAL